MSDFKNTVAATENSLEILSLIESHNGARLSAIARELDISKSTAHSHLNTLRSYGYVTKKGEVYHLSLKFFHLGQHARNQNKRFRAAGEKVQELGEDLNHSIDFDVEIDGRIMTLFHEADDSTEVGLKEGDHLYVHTSSTGKAILAELPRERVDEILDQWGMPTETRHTLTDRSTFIDELEHVKQRGYAVIDQEWLEGLRAVGVAVLLPSGQPFGALSAGGPTYRLTEEAIENNVAPALLRAAENLEEEIQDIVV
jgi:DNA-binding IclR family transcriptional regulator